MKKRIYVVDEHDLVRSALVKIINDERDMMVCGEAKGAKKACRELAVRHPVLIDWSGEHAASVELIQAVRRRFPAVGILVLSVHDELE